ncbi:hypothetical protein ABEF95_001202 [Exophiala dermatitidis]
MPSILTAFCSQCWHRHPPPEGLFQTADIQRVDSTVKGTDIATLVHFAISCVYLKNTLEIRCYRARHGEKSKSHFLLSPATDLSR